MLFVSAVLRGFTVAASDARLAREGFSLRRSDLEDQMAGRRYGLLASRAHGFVHASAIGEPTQGERNYPSGDESASRGRARFLCASTCVASGRNRSILPLWLGSVMGYGNSEQVHRSRLRATSLGKGRQGTISAQAAGLPDERIRICAAQRLWWAITSWRAMGRSGMFRVLSSITPIGTFVISGRH